MPTMSHSACKHPVSSLNSNSVGLILSKRKKVRNSERMAKCPPLSNVYICSNLVKNKFTFALLFLYCKNPGKKSGSISFSLFLFGSPFGGKHWAKKGKVCSGGEIFFISNESYSLRCTKPVRKWCPTYLVQFCGLTPWSLTATPVYLLFVFYPYIPPHVIYTSSFLFILHLREFLFQYFFLPHIPVWYILLPYIISRYIPSPPYVYPFSICLSLYMFFCMFSLEYFFSTRLSFVCSSSICHCFVCLLPIYPFSLCLFFLFLSFLYPPFICLSFVCPFLMYFSSVHSSPYVLLPYIPPLMSYCRIFPSHPSPPPNTCMSFLPRSLVCPSSGCLLYVFLPYVPLYPYVTPYVPPYVPCIFPFCISFLLLEYPFVWFLTHSLLMCPLFCCPLRIGPCYIWPRRTRVLEWGIRERSLDWNCIPSTTGFFIDASICSGIWFSIWVYQYVIPQAFRLNNQWPSGVFRPTVKACLGLLYLIRKNNLCPSLCIDN